jgi:hypothetical protein
MGTIKEALKRLQGHKVYPGYQYATFTHSANISLILYEPKSQMSFCFLWYRYYISHS